MNFNFMSKAYIFFILLCLIGCKKSESISSLEINCPFVQDDDTEDGRIDDAERKIMEDCFASRITNQVLLVENLIGTWDLIGHGEGWVTNVSQPCASIEITSDEAFLTFANEWIDTSSVHSWSLIPGFAGDFLLELDPPSAIGLSLNVHCENYMYLDHTPADGNMYLFGRK